MSRPTERRFVPASSRHWRRTIPGENQLLRLGNALGTTGLVVFAFCAWLSTAGAYIGIGLMVLATIVALPYRYRLLAREPLVWLSFVFLVYVLIRAAVAARAVPQADGLVSGAAQAWAKLFFFWIAALWLHGKPRLMWLVIALAAAGLLVRMGTHFNWSQPLDFLESKRAYGFGLSHIGFGLYSAAILLGLAVFARRALAGIGGTRRVFAIMGWIVVGLVYLQGLVLTDSRGAWLAAAIAALVVLGVYMAKARRISRRALLLGAAAAAVIAVLLAFNARNITARLGQEHETFARILALDWQHIPYTSVGTRIHLYIYGIEHWLARPWFGWGPGVIRYLLEHGPKVLRYPHVHNTFLELLAELGIVGLGLFLLALGRIVYAIRNAREMPSDLKIFLLGAWIMWLLWSMTDVRITHVDGAFYWYLLAGVSCMFIFKPPRERPRGPPTQR
jgi:O-antigen ligase